MESTNLSVLPHLQKLFDQVIKVILLYHINVKVI